MRLLISLININVAWTHGSIQMRYILIIYSSATRVFLCCKAHYTPKEKTVDELKKKAVVCVLPLASSVEPGFLSPSCYLNQTVLDCQSTFLDASKS